jgi:hypothetical protein
MTMLRKALGVVVLVGVSGLLSAQTKDKDTKKDAKKGTKATVVAVDRDKKTLTLEVGGKKQEFTVTKDTKFYGPRGGVSKAGIKDDRLKPGAQVSVETDGKTLKAVHFGFRKKGKDKGKEKEKAKDKA